MLSASYKSNSYIMTAYNLDVDFYSGNSHGAKAGRSQPLT